jgi:hypothetical protein
MDVFGLKPNISKGTDAMRKIITSTDSFKQLFGLLDGDLLNELLGLSWRVIAAVHCFFQRRDHTIDNLEV